jgi:hypothetical protein
MAAPGSEEMTPMPKPAKGYILGTALGGLALLSLGIYQGEFPNPARFITLFALALLASTLKVRLPGLTSTISLNFLFILLGIADCSFTETILMACGAALVQSMWKAKCRPVQVLFSVPTLTISTGAAYWGSNLVLAAWHTTSLAILLTLGASLFFIFNTALVAMVLTLLEEKPFQRIWRQCHVWSFPYYLVGAAIAGLMSASGRAAGWQPSLLVLPVMYLNFLCYREIVANATREQLQFAVEVQPAVVMVGSAERS